LDNGEKAFIEDGEITKGPKGTAEKDDWAITKRAGTNTGVVSWEKDGATITKEKSRSKAAGLGGERYVARVGNDEYAALSLNGAKEWATKRLKKISESESYGNLSAAKEYTSHARLSEAARLLWSEDV